MTDNGSGHGYDFHEPLAEIIGRLRVKIYELEDQLDSVTADLTQVLAHALAMSGGSAPPPIPRVDCKATAKARDVASGHGYTLDHVRGRDRRRAACVARCAVIVALRDEDGMSYSEIGRLLRRDHSSVMSLYRRAVELGVKTNGVEVGP